MGNLRIVKRESEKETFAAMYDTYAEPIYRFIYYKTYHKETAEDLTSTTFLKALDNFEKYVPSKGHISTWLYCIARNLVIDHYRKNRKTVALRDIWDLADETDIALDAQEREQIRELQKVMKTLPMDQRDILIMRVWQDMPYKEIAGVVGKTEAACKMAFSRIISGLRKDMSAFAMVLLFKYLI